MTAKQIWWGDAFFLSRPDDPWTEEEAIAFAKRVCEIAAEEEAKREPEGEAS